MSRAFWGNWVDLGWWVFYNGGVKSKSKSNIMVIEISLLPQVVQQQILAVEQGQTVAFTNHGKVIGTLSGEKPKDSLMAVAGILQGRGIDGLEYERQIRSEWVREWERE